MGRIFISYRRDDSQFSALALYQRLEHKFGRSGVFMDVEGHIRVGARFQEVLEEHMTTSDIVLVVIGPKWTDIIERRQAEPNDYVRIEIEAAFAQHKHIVPVLIENTPIPQSSRLPASIRGLPQLHAARIRSDRFADDCDGLVDEIIKIRKQKARPAKKNDAH